MDVGEASSNIHDHGHSVDKKRGRVRCNYCRKVVSGTFCLKCHLGGVRNDVVPCKKVPANVQVMFRNLVMENNREGFSKDVASTCHTDHPFKRNQSVMSIGFKHRKRDANQTAGGAGENHDEMDSGVEDGTTGHNPVLNVNHCEFGLAVDHGAAEDLAQKQVEKCIARFFYETGINFGVASSSSFRRMINATMNDGQAGYEIPTLEELRGRILQDELQETQKYVKKIRQSWANTGCSLLLDGWVDRRGRHLVSFIVECLKGSIYLHSADVTDMVNDVNALHLLLKEVIEEIGIDNVVQIVASTSTGWMRAVGENFMEKHSVAVWSISASHCIELMLERIGSMVSIKRTLDKAKIMIKFVYSNKEVLKLMKLHTKGVDLLKASWMKFAVPFLTLENITSEKNNLEKMFASSEWRMLIWAPTIEGKRVADLVQDLSFWTGAEKALKATIPLLRVYQLIYEADKPLAGYIYETIDQAKETIKEEFKNKRFQYKPFWDEIDNVWNNYLHSPLHGAGYFLNPSIYYSEDFYPDEEVAFGLLCCVVRMVRDKRTQDLISLQLDKYRKPKGDFEVGSTVDNRDNVTPVQWWSTYGNQCPELQAFAIRVLSQTCDGASRYRLNRGLAEKLLFNRRNAVEQQRLADLSAVHYNLHLRNNQMGIGSTVVGEEIDSFAEWITDKAPEIGPENVVVW